MERHQPEKRQKLGLLEKHKDYVVRAKESHRKEQVLKRLHEQARQRNVSEFKFQMLSSTTIDKGVVLQSRKTPKQRLEEERMKSQAIFRAKTQHIQRSRAGGWGSDVDEQAVDVRLLSKAQKKARDRLLVQDTNALKYRKAKLDKQIEKNRCHILNERVTTEMKEKAIRSKKIQHLVEELETKRHLTDNRMRWKEQVEIGGKTLVRYKWFEERKK